MPALKYWDAATSTWKIGAVGLPSGQVWSTVIGDGVNTSFLVTHGFGTRSVYVSIYRNTPPYDEVSADVERTDTNSVTIRTAPTVPAVSEYIVVVASAGTQATLNVTMDQWHVVGQPGEPAFSAGYSNRGGGDPTVAFRKYPDGKVQIRGGITVPAAAGAMFVLPVGYRPTGYQRFSCVDIGGPGTTFVQVYVDTAGGVSKIASSATSVDLSIIEFDTESAQQSASVTAQPMDSWHVVGQPGEPPFNTNWANYGGGEATVAFRKYPDGRVRLRGSIIRTGTPASGEVMFVLPAGYRPASGTPRFTVGCGPTLGQVPIYVGAANDGGVRCWINMQAGQWYDLASVEFDTETVAAYPSASIGPPKVTSLPTNPVDGQEVYFSFLPTTVPASVVPLLWHLRYDASIPCWLPVGNQRPAVAHYQTGASTSMGVSAWGTYDANDPRVTVPLTGTYEVETGSSEVYGGAGNLFYTSIFRNGTQMSAQYESNVTLATNASGPLRLYVPDVGLTVNDIVRQYYYLNAGAPQNIIMRGRYMSIRPMRIG